MTPPKAKHRPIRAIDVRERLRDHIYASYMNYSFFIKGATIAVAGVALVYLLGKPDLTFRGVRLALWLASTGFSLVTIATWNRGAAFTNSRANAFDVILPISSGIAEVVMFVVIAPPFSDLPPDSWVYWYAAFTVHTIIAVFIITNRNALAKATDYEHTLNDDILRYKNWLILDRRYAASLGIIAFLIFVLTKYVQAPTWMPKVPFDSSTTSWLHTSIGIGLSLLSFSIVLTASKQYKVLSEI